ncbi:DUF4227 family protein [Paenibacillus sp. L3-i20]|uniref:DUF4227 family protein n=1 Tax=Paenibacillus sp. L3-i20 TaxID=2905833 RepID=UPI001EDE6AFC|nr:DUF4227 family protein [Paenibacillus sp. L3-i20]GKU79620.1 hypothetical protein L3i20_v240170 [Paenibacillus sp. L3-i20]
MVFSLRGWLNRILFIIVFLILLFFAAGGYRLLVEVISPIHPYQKPRGDAMKVFITDVESPEQGNSADRLRWFYWYGE